MVNERVEVLGELSLVHRGPTVELRGPAAPGEPLQVDAAPEALRQWTRFDAAGRYRPLSGARTLRPGWVAHCDEVACEAAIDAIYPLARVHNRQYADGSLRVVPLEEVLARQSGRYEGSASLPPGARALLREVLCGGCVRAPVWAGENPGPGAIACPEACSVFVAFAREAALWEESPPSAAPVEPTVPFAAFDAPGNELREAYLARRFPPRA